MPDKSYKFGRCGGKRCIACWKNKLNHGNKLKITKKQKEKRKKDPTFNMIKNEKEDQLPKPKTIKRYRRCCWRRRSEKKTTAVL